MLLPLDSPGDISFHADTLKIPLCLRRWTHGLLHAMWFRE